MHYNADGGIFTSGAKSAAIPASSLLYAEDPIEEGGDRSERFLGPLPVRCVADAGHHQRVDRAVALVLRRADLRERAVAIRLALHSQDRHADIGERVGD